jgi:hypothetical protein
MRRAKADGVDRAGAIHADQVILPNTDHPAPLVQWLPFEGRVLLLQERDRSRSR